MKVKEIELQINNTRYLLKPIFLIFIQIKYPIIVLDAIF